jgi:Flp pilus assembly protein TadD
MQFASRSCTLSLLLFTSFLLFGSDNAFCQSDAPPRTYEQIEHQALALFHQGDVTGATSLLESTLAEVQNGNDPQWEADILAVLGFIYEKTGQYTQAEDTLIRSVNDWTRLRGPNTPTLAGPLGNLGELYAKAGQFSRAEKLLSHALSISRTYGSPPDSRTRLLINLGNVYVEQHKDAEAEQTAREALSVFMSMAKPSPETSAVFSLLGSIAYRAGRAEQAETGCSGRCRSASPLCL